MLLHRHVCTSPADKRVYQEHLKVTTNHADRHFKNGVPNYVASVHRLLLSCPSFHLVSLVSSVGRAPDCSAGGRGFEPQTGPTLRVLK